MTSLVGYASSDEDVESGQPVEESNGVDQSSPHGGSVLDSEQQGDAIAISVPTEADQRSLAGPAPGPSRQTADDSSEAVVQGSTRAQVQALTMPRFPNFDIPRSPSPPPANSEEAAELAARTRKFERFLELKKQGIHFNDRLAASTAIRNPQLFQKLAEFAGISPAEQYDTTIESLGVPTEWPTGFLEDLISSNEKKLKKERAQRTNVQFVASKGSRQA